MARIVGGSVGGRRIVAPPGRGTRPTSDRAREGLFGSLSTLVDLDGARVLDLYAGSGAVGLEALSRGAAYAVLVESDARAARLIRQNAATLRLFTLRVVVERVERFLALGPETDGSDGYDVVFADPPYVVRDADLTAVLASLPGHGWLTPGAVVVVERPSRGGAPAWPNGVEPIKERRYGEGTLWYGRRP